MREIDLATFAAAVAAGATVIDVREPHGYISRHVTGARERVS
jgi:rhodanese-related sulfurtransferase